MKIPPLNVLRAYRTDKSGAVTVESSVLLTLLIFLVGGSVETGYAFWQWNAAQQSARVGARIAATSDPVSNSLKSMTGLGGNVGTGDPMPAYSVECSTQTTSCNSGSYNSTEMNRIIFGPDNDGQCAATAHERRGMCDLFDEITQANVRVKYQNSGLGTAGSPADIQPIITLTVSDLKFNFLFLDIITGETLTKMPDVKATVLSEDLRTSA